VGVGVGLLTAAHLSADELRAIHLPLARLEELDRRCAASLRQKERRYPMRTMSWDEIRAERARPGPGQKGTAQGVVAG
jgi:hypothetical protein